MKWTNRFRRMFLWGVIAIFCVVVIFVVGRYVVGHRPVYYAGTLETTKIIISSRVASDIANVLVAEGDGVKRQQALMELSCDAYKIFARQVDNDFNRATQLIEKGHLTQAEYDVLIRNKQDNDLKLTWCVLRSPIDGIVITRFREVGEVVAPGTPMISVANPYDIYAYFYVPYGMLYKLKIGQRVIGVLPEADDKQFVGRIVKISEQAEFTPKNVQTRDERTRLVYGIKVQFENPDLILKSGMTIESTLMDDE